MMSHLVAQPPEEEEEDMEDEYDQTEGDSLQDFSDLVDDQIADTDSTDTGDDE